MLTKEEFTNLGFSNGMSEALLAAFGKKLLPNPTVGAALIDQNDKLIISSSHEGKGTDHAEASIIKKIIELDIDTNDCTLFITLEPCMHEDTSPSCAMLIVKSGLFKKIVIGDVDPDIRTNGEGLVYMRKNKIDAKIESGATSFIDPSYISYVNNTAPYIISKFGVTKDWSIYSPNNTEKYITNDYSRKLGHILRSNVDAILIGKNTLLIDDPKLNIRYNLKTSEPLKVVLWGNDYKSEKFLINYEKYNSFLYICNGSEGYEYINDNIVNKERIIFIENNKINSDMISNAFKKININSVLLEGGISTWKLFDSAVNVDKIMKDKSTSSINKMYIFESNKKFNSKDQQYLDKQYINNKYTLLNNINYSEDSLYIYEKVNQ